VENFIGSYMSLWDRIEDPKVVEAWHAMNTWVRDIIDMTGGAYRQLINEFYKENRLKEGTLVLRGERVDLKKLTADVLNVIAEADHITPPCQSSPFGLRARPMSWSKSFRGPHRGFRQTGGEPTKKPREARGQTGSISLSNAAQHEPTSRWHSITDREDCKEDVGTS